MAISSIASASTSAIDAYTAQSRSSDLRQNSSNTQQSQQSSAITKLSAEGVAKSSLEDLQAKARTLKSLSKSPNLQDFKVAVQGVISSINTIRQSVAAAETSRGAKQAADNVDKSVFGNKNESSTLQQAGLNRQTNGSLGVDEKNFDAALQKDRQGTLNAFSALASRVDEAAGKQIQANGNSDINTSNLSRSQNAVQNQRNSDEARLNAQRQAQQLAAQQSLASGYAARNAVASYFTVNSL